LVLHTFEGDCNSYAKTSAGNIKSICLKYGQTNFCFYVGISMMILWKQTFFVCQK
jgi:hypothetical protein